MKLLKNSISLSMIAVCAVACGPEGGFEGDDAPLSDYHTIFEGTPSNDELPFEIKADGPPPRQHADLREFQSSVKSQGSRGVCSIFSTIALMEHLYLLAGAGEQDFSEQYLQWSAKFQVNSFPNSSGSNSFFNLQAINRFGIPEESAWPYEPSPWDETNDPDCGGEEKERPTHCHTNGHPPEEAIEAEKFFLPAGRFVNSRRAAIMDHIRTSGTGVAVGLDFFYQSWNHRRSTLPRNLENWDLGIVLAPNAEDVEESHKQQAGHEVLVIGWDLDLEFPRRDANGDIVRDAAGNPVMERGFWIMKNSWGTAGFGIDNPFGAGYGYLSMEYIDEYGRARASDIPDIVLPEPEEDDDLGAGETFESEEIIEIPDNDPTGIRSTIAVDADGVTRSVTVQVEIEHTWRGDLLVRLTKDGQTAVLHNRSGGGQRDLELELTVEDFEGIDKAGDWTLEVVDTATADTGRLRSWSITLH